MTCRHRSTTSSLLLSAMLLSMSLSASAACGGDDHAPPTVTITSPSDRATVILGMTRESPVTVALTGFTLKAPGSCAGAAHCGHIHLNINDMACNDPAMSSPYNNASATTTIVAKYHLCPAGTMVGPHVLTIGLHDDNHDHIKADGKNITHTINVTTAP